jgi:spermidine synthase
MAYKQEVNVPLVMTIGIVSGILLLVTVIGTQAWYQSEEQDEVMLKAGEAFERAPTLGLPNPTFAELKDTQTGALAAKPHWVDAKKKDRVAVPIGDAMEYLENHGGKLP